MERQMADEKKVAPVNSEFLGLLSIPSESKVPDPINGLSTPAEYDLYFRILRNNPGLLEWSRSCLDTYDSQLQELDSTTLTAEEKYQIAIGIVLVQRITLERWVKTGEAIRKEM
jgi:hypothetical protein